MSDKLQRLTCCCCGDSTIGRQWWNRDTGFGLCDRCVEYCHADQTDDDGVNRSYGKRGYHYDLPQEELQGIEQ